MFIDLSTLRFPAHIIARKYYATLRLGYYAYQRCHALSDAESL